MEETIPVQYDDGYYYMIPNMALFTDAYNLDDPIIQDGFVSLYSGAGTEVDGSKDYNKWIYMEPLDDQIHDYYSMITDGASGSGVWDNNTRGIMFSNTPAPAAAAVGGIATKQ